MNKIKRLQLGENLDFYTVSYDKISTALRKILVDSKYVENAKQVSRLVYDQPEKPVDRAIWWIEWVLRHPNRSDQQSPVITLGYIVGNSIDIIAFSAIVLIMQMFVTCKLIASTYKTNIFRCVFSQKKRFNNVDIHKKQQ